MLSAVRSISVPAESVAATEAAIRSAGSDEHELFVLWTGVVDGEVFDVRMHHVPDQVSYRTKTGCGVRVGAPALHKLNVWLFEHEEVLGIQIHSHPGEAYHSSTDDAFPIVTTEGGISIVVADFGADGISAATTAMYRLVKGEWVSARPRLELA